MINFLNLYLNHVTNRYLNHQVLNSDCGTICWSVNVLNEEKMPSCFERSCLKLLKLHLKQLDRNKIEILGPAQNPAMS